MSEKTKGSTDSTGLYQRGRVWWITYCGPRPDGSWGQIRESSESSDPAVAVKLRDERLRRYSIVREQDLAEALAKRVAYEERLTKQSTSSPRVKPFGSAARS